MTTIQKVFTQRKKTGLELEAEQFEKNQYSHIGKAINSVEGAPKEKHVRGIILGTYHYCGASIFFKHTNFHNLQSNAICCWKYLYVIHKILRDGHEQALKDILKNDKNIKELRDLWVHLKSGYGTIIAAFCKLLCQKIKFHRKYRRIPGNLTVSNDVVSLDKGIDSIFELCTDLLDYLDELVSFELAVVNSLDKSKSNSMTPSGQCRLTPLIQVIQDMATLYDVTIRLMFKLHSKLNVDDLSGHRQRFLKAFEEIKKFFKLAQTFQYFKTLIQVPSLPETPPNFLVESDLVAQKALVVNVTEDTEDLNSSDSPLQEKPSPLIDFDQIDKSDKFDQIFGQMDAFNFSNDDRNELQKEIDYLKALIERMKAEHNERVNSLLARIRVLEEEVKGLVQLKDQYEERIREYERHKCDSADVEKFNKIKEAYAKLREEHVKVLRQQGITNHELESSKKEAETIQRLLNEQRKAYSDLEKQSLIHSSMEKDIDQCRRELVEAQAKLSEKEKSHYELLAKFKNIEAKNTDLLKQMESLQNEFDQQRRVDDNNRSQLESELTRTKFELDSSKSENSKLLSKLNTIEQQLKTELENSSKMRDSHNNLIVSSCQAGKVIINKAYSSLQSEHIVNCRTSCDLVQSSVNDTMDSINEFKKIKMMKPSAEKQIKLSESIYSVSHKVANCLIQGRMLNNDSGSLYDQINQNIDGIYNDSLSMLDTVQKLENSESITNKLIENLKKLHVLSEDVKINNFNLGNQTSEDLFDEELRNTRNAIDLAEQRFKMILDESRSKFSGIQLEVNEKILDSCSELMYAIKILIDRSKKMQTEIVSDGKGTGSIKDFYKKHHKWTEGLISAAKAVGAGAMSLCESADNLLTKDGKFEELIVCAREITASTTQLVVSSRVKADPNSPNLKNLFVASKDVSNATGKVIANAKNAVTVLDNKGTYNFSNLTLTQARKLEMESQVKVLELESDLEKERVRLGDLRKKHYQLAGESIDPQDLLSILNEVDQIYQLTEGDAS